MRNLEQKELLKQAIEGIHRRGSRDYESLMREVGRKFRLVVANAAQRAFLKYSPIRKDVTCIWSRGVGKTFSIAFEMEAVAHAMPRSTNLIIVPSYKKFFKEMLPSFLKALEMLGYFEGLHYFIGKKPPAGWTSFAMPYMQPDDWDNCIIWYTGAIWQLISQDVKGSGRALSADSQIRDEALMLNKAVMDETSTATMRGSNVQVFQDSPYFGKTLTLSSMPITQGSRWLLAMEELSREFPLKYYYSEFNVGANLDNLRKGYVTDAMKGALYKWLFEAEYLNIAPQMVLDGYYSLLKESIHGYYPIHGDYRQHEDCRYDYADNDLRAGVPLIVGVDWGVRINYMVACQLHDDKDGRYLRALKDFYALGSDGEIQQDMVKKFADYYRTFGTKRIILFYDRSGNHKTGITNETRAEMLISQLTEAGWSVEPMSVGGANILHSYRRLMWENVLKEQDRFLIKFRVNLLNCRNLLISMQNTRTKSTQRDQITKDKSSERANSGIDPRHASDPSDAIDQIFIDLVGTDFSFESAFPMANFGNR